MEHDEHERIERLERDYKELEKRVNRLVFGQVGLHNAVTKILAILRTMAGVPVVTDLNLKAGEPTE